LNLALVNPFLLSANHVFETVFQMRVDAGSPTQQRSPAPAVAVSGVIGVCGDIVGNISVSFPVNTARRVTALFTGQEPATVTEAEMADAIGELADMIVGRARAQLHRTRLDMSCPSIVMGKSHLVTTPASPRAVAIPCMCDAGEFSIELAFVGDPETGDLATQSTGTRR